MSVELDFVAPLFVPAHRPERFAKAAASGADAIILDLEDAVPVDAKDVARDALRTDFTTLPIIARINAAGTPWHAADLAAVRALPIAAIMVPKAEAGDGLAAIATEMPVIALIESARGLASARTVAALPGIARLAFGSVDFCAELGCAHIRDALLAARSELVLAARLGATIAPVDGVTTAIDDMAQVADDARYARTLGFGGKLCIHPKQIHAVKEGFLPDAAEIAWAKKVLASGDGATAVDGAMVDEPVRKRARSILARAACA